MRQICTSRKVWLPILLLFTAVFIFACWDRGVSIDFDGTGLYHASPLDSAIEAVPVSFHGQLRKSNPRRHRDKLFLTQKSPFLK